MSNRKHRRRGADSLGSVVDDAAHVAAGFGPLGAMATGVIGFVVFYIVLPITLMAWTEQNKAKLVGSTAAALSTLLDQVMWYRFIDPCQWVGVAILLVCSTIAAWKLLVSNAVPNAGLAETSLLAKVLARLLQ